MSKLTVSRYSFSTGALLTNITLERMLDALTLLNDDGVETLSPGDLMNALFATTLDSLEYERAFGGSEFIPSEPSSPVQPGDSVLASTPPPERAPTACVLPPAPVHVSAFAPAAHPLLNPVVASLPSGNHVDPVSGLEYHIPQPSSTPGRWYSVTKGRRIGVFETWATVAPYVVGASRVCFTKHSTRNAAVLAFATDLVAQQTAIVD